MRKSSLFLTTLVAVSALAISWRVGDFRAMAERVIVANPSESPFESTPTASSSSPSEPEPSPGKPKASTATPVPSSKPTSAKPTRPTAPVVKSVKSDVIEYKYGVLQISMTAVDGNISAIQVIQGESSNGRAAAYQSLSTQLIQSQGQRYENVSGATYTTEAFIRAYNNAVVKF